MEGCWAGRRRKRDERVDAEAGGPDASRCFDEDPWDFWHTSVLVATIRDGRGLDHQPQRETHVARRPGKPQFAGE